MTFKKLIKMFGPKYQISLFRKAVTLINSIKYHHLPIAAPCSQNNQCHNHIMSVTES